MTYDLFTYNGEEDMLDIRMSLLDPYVDKFVICESTETFSGKPKPLHWENRGDRFKKWQDKVIYCVVDEYDNEEIMEQIVDRDYVDEYSFKRAFYQKETLRTVLEKLDLDDEDIIYYGDVDEIWKPKQIDDKVYKLRQLAYSYYLNNRSPEDWRGTIVTKWKNVKGKCLNDLRANPENIMEDGGWHFTNLGNADFVKHKIASYDHQEVNIPIIVDGIQERIDNNVDFLGRGFKFWVDHEDLPVGILERKDEFKQKGLWK